MMPMCIGDATFQASAAEKPQEAAPQTALAAPRGIVPKELACLGDVRVSSRTRRTRVLTTSGETAEPVTRWSVNATTAIVKARVRHNDGKSSSYVVVRPRDTDRTTWARRYRSAATPRTNSLRRQLRCTSPSTKRERSTRLCRPRAALGARSPRTEWRADSELFKRADTAAIALERRR
jgi:hypothetical protein